MKIKKCKIDCFQKSCILLCMALFSCSQYDCVVPDNGKTGEGERNVLGRNRGKDEDSTGSY